MDNERQRIVNDIEKYGCHVIMVPGDDYVPGFAYTIGLYERFGHPEIIVFGLRQEVLSDLLNNACNMIGEGKRFEVGCSYDGLIKVYTVQFLQVDHSNYKEHVGYAKWYYGNVDFPILQMIWPDKAGLFPWEESFFAEWRFKQPLLDRNMDFKFLEPENVAVFTTKDVLKGAPILYVYHNDDDGAWQFHSTADPDMGAAVLVAFSEITRIDPTVNDLYFLPYGGRAWRNSPQDDWEY